MTETIAIPNGIYTVNSPSGEHRTFKIHTARKGNLEGKRIVSLLIGQDNENSYKGFGFVDDTGIRVWRKYQSDGYSMYEKYARCLWDLINFDENSHFHGLGMTLLVSKRCIRCNKTLTTPESIENGIGPECIKHFR
jgi:hypothetical protein